MGPTKYNARPNNKRPQNGIASRKLMRKAKFKEKKMKRAIHYAKSRNSEKVCIKKEDLEKLNRLNGATNLHSLLDGKILSNCSQKYKHPANDAKKKIKKKEKQIRDKTNNENRKDFDETDSESESFKVASNNSERMVRLQAFVEQESKRSNQTNQKKNKVGDKYEESKNENLIKDKKRLQELRMGQDSDRKEINKLARAMNVDRRYVKNRVCKVYDTEFGDLIRDIESGNVTEMKDCDNCIYSDDDLENDLNIALGKESSHNKKSTHPTEESNKAIFGNYTDRSPSGVQNDDDDHSEHGDIEDANSSCEDGASSDNSDANDAECEMSDGEQDVSHFFDNEAEECSESEDGDSTSGENRETLLFEGGGSTSMGSQSESTKIWSHKSESIFDLYSSDTDDTDLDGFVVDDNTVEFESDISSFSEDTSESSPEKQNNKRKNHISATNLNSNGHNIKRRRILSSNSESSDCTSKDALVMKGILKAPDSKGKTKREKHGKCVSFRPVEDSSDSVEDSSDSEALQQKPAERDHYEDIYGRIRDKQGNIIEPERDSPSKKYIPPAQRKLMALNQSDQKKELLAILRKKLKGLLNRLAESNMPGITNQIEAMFKDHSRNDMNETLTNLLLECIVTAAMTPDRLVQDHACLIASLSANVGPEVGGHIFTEFVVQFIEELELFEPSNTQQLDSKELDNLLHLIVQLYNFKVVDSSVIYDILHKLLENFQEKEVELVLLVLRSVGFTLRKSDPLALKQFISSVQSKAAAATTTNQDQAFTRVRFMLEVLSAIKNNNMSKVPNYDPSHGEHLRTLMKAIVRQGCSPSDLKVSLSDILKSKVVGRWWIVGSAFSGGLKENQDIPSTLSVAPHSRVCDNYSDAFTEKATKLHLSRPPRMNILYALTEGSEDYMDAFEKLIQLKLSPSQEQDIFNVILICCQRGKEYNKFYSCVAIKLCMFQKRFKRSLQFSLWDKFKELSTMKPSRISNLAKFVAEVVAEDAVNLSVFKTLPLLETDSTMVNFLRQSLIGLLLHPTGENKVYKAFNKLCISPKLKVLRQVLRVFILQFIVPKDVKNNEDLQLLSARTKMAAEILETGGGIKL